MSAPVFPYRKRPLAVFVRGPLTTAETVQTAHGPVTAAAGDYVVKDPRTGDEWPLKQHFLAASYEPIEPNDEARGKAMRGDIRAKCNELIAIAATKGTRGIVNGELLAQVESLVVEYGDAQRRAGGESIAGQMRSSFLALGDEVADMRRTGAIADEAADRMTTNIRMLIELFAPASDTRRAVFGQYQNGHKFDWENNAS